MHGDRGAAAADGEVLSRAYQGNHTEGHANLEVGTRCLGRHFRNPNVWEVALCEVADDDSGTENAGAWERVGYMQLDVMQGDGGDIVSAPAGCTYFVEAADVGKGGYKVLPRGNRPGLGVAEHNVRQVPEGYTEEEGGYSEVRGGAEHEDEGDIG